MKNIFITCFIALTFFSCSGDGGGNGSGTTTGYTHNELAERFVYNLNLDAEFDVTLVKSSTETRNFIVVYDPLTDSYDAISISNYLPTMNATDHYNDLSTQFYADLDVLPGYDSPSGWVSTEYRDRNSGLFFEKGVATSKDLAKMKALKEVIQIEKTAEYFSSEFGLSNSRGKEVAKLSAHWKKASMKAMTAKEIDSFSTELLGFSLTQGVDAYKTAIEGDASSLESLVKQSANANGITPEHAGKLMTKVFGL